MTTLSPDLAPARVDSTVQLMTSMHQYMPPLDLARRAERCEQIAAEEAERRPNLADASRRVAEHARQVQRQRAEQVPA